MNKKLSNDIKLLIKNIRISNDWVAKSKLHIKLVNFFKKIINVYTIDDLRKFNNIQNYLDILELNEQQIKNFIQLFNDAKFHPDFLTFLNNFRIKRKWPSTSNKYDIVKNIFINLNIFTIDDIISLFNNDPTLNVLTKTKLNNSHVNDIILMIKNISQNKIISQDQIISQDENIVDPYDFDYIKNNINSFTDNQLQNLFIQYGLVSYNDYLKKIILVYLKNI